MQQVVLVQCMGAVGGEGGRDASAGRQAALLAYPKLCAVLVLDGKGKRLAKIGR